MLGPMTARALVALALASLSAVTGCHQIHLDPNAKPELQVGTGEDDFETLGTGVTVPVIYGPQGGSHIWFAARCRALGEHAVLDYSLEDEQGNVVSGPQQVMLPDDPDDDEGWRTLTGLQAFVGDLGEGMHLTFKGHVDDSIGHTLDASGEATVHGSDSL
ncbi:Hypothetical protein A7982_11829 [Minicystis rosea]|nr:Hypothetical protein A7982_11829 [Minicystis rosea]